jgi:predicted peptidase
MELPYKLTFCVALLLCLPHALVSKQREDLLQAKAYKDLQGRTMPYRLFVPPNRSNQKRFPLVLFLHGGGGRGDDNLKQIQGGNGFIIDLLTKPESQAKYPCFVLAPQSPQQEGWIEDDSITPTLQLHLTLELIDHLTKQFNIDSKRIYVVGQSMGGFGTFAIITMRPAFFAAAVPICGGGDESKAGRIAHVPIWAFHGEQDESVKVERSRNMIEAITRAGGKPKYTEYKGEGHLIWNKVVNEPELLPWMFSQKRS